MPRPRPFPARSTVRSAARTAAAAAGLLAVLAALAVAGCAGSRSQMVEPLAARPDVPFPEHDLQDRVVAVVDEEAILLSDIEEVLGLGLMDTAPTDSPEDLRSRALDGLIDHQLRYQAAERFGLGQVSVERIEAQVESIRERFPDPAAFDERLAELGMSEQELHQLVARQLLVLRYVDERLGARVFVGLEDIRAYYEASLVPELEAAGEPVPPLEEVREDIRQVLRERRLVDEVERWTEELRREADVQVFLDEVLTEMPPVVWRIGPPAAR